MTDNTGTFLITLAVPNQNDPDALNEYTTKAPKLAMDYGLQSVVQFSIVDQIFGEHQTAIVSVVKFPSEEDIVNMFESEAYQPLLALRDRAFESISYYISPPEQSLSLGDTDGKTYLLVMAVPGDKQALGEYQQNLRPMAAQYGAQPLANVPIASMYIGEHPSAFLNITEFPDADSIRSFFGADDYQPFLPLREKALLNLNLYIGQ